MERLRKIKRLAAGLILPRTDHIPDEHMGVVTAFPFSYSTGRTIAELCLQQGYSGPDNRILIVGSHGGRDYFWLTGFGFTVDMLDLGHHPWGACAYLGDACRKETWEQIPVKYDMVVFCDVLEHLPRDFDALCHARSILGERGVVFVTVPYRHDEEETHVRSYTRKTMCRLVTGAGYVVERVHDRPGVFEAFQRTVNSLNYGLALLMPSTRLGATVLRRCLEAEYVLNHVSRSLFRMIGWSINKGIMLTARVDPKHTSEEYVSANARKFVDAPESLA